MSEWVGNSFKLWDAIKMKNRKRREFCQNRGLPNLTSMFLLFFYKCDCYKMEKVTKKLVNWAKIPILGGRGGGVDGVSPYGKNSHIFPFFILISFVKSFKVFQFVASGLF